MKNPFSLISDAYLRWRHSRGFGVHSPFAYHLVDMAVRPGVYGWYGYEDIERALLYEKVESRGRLRREARLLLRLLTQTESRRLVCAHGEDLMKAVAKGAGVRYSAGVRKSGGFNKGDFFFFRKGECSGQTVREAIQSGSAVMAAAPSEECMEAIDACLRDGVLMTGTRIVVAVPRPDMARVDYSMRF